MCWRRRFRLGYIGRHIHHGDFTTANIVGASQEFPGVAHIPQWATPFEIKPCGYFVAEILRYLSFGLFVLVEGWFPWLQFRWRYRLSKDWPFSPLDVTGTSANGVPVGIVIRAADGTEYAAEMKVLQLSEQTVKLFFPCPNGQEPWLVTQNESTAATPPEEPRELEAFLAPEQRTFRVCVVDFEQVRFWVCHTPAGPCTLRPLEPRDGVLFRQSGHAILSGVPNEQAHRDRRILFHTGDIEEPALWELLRKEVCRGWFGFQVACLVLWTVDEYYIYAIAVACLMTIEIAFDVQQALNVGWRICALAKELDNEPITVYRTWSTGSAWEEGRDLPYAIAAGVDCTSVTQSVLAKDLVPGDVFRVEPNMRIPCDAVLAHGTVVVDESKLTGERGAVLKTPLACTAEPSCCSSVSSSHDDSSSSDISHGSTDSNNKNSLVEPHWMLAGTSPIYVGPSDGPAFAVAVRTQFQSTRGKLIRSVLYPCQGHRRTFEKQARSYLKILIVVTCLGSGAAFVLSRLWFRFDWWSCIMRSLDLFSDAIPPALPSVLTVGVASAVSRLKKKYNVACSDVSQITTAANLQTFIFDKTGTLTEPDLEFGGAIVVEGFSFPASVRPGGRTNVAHGLDGMANKISKQCRNDYAEGRPSFGPRRFHVLSNFPEFVQALATCHAVCSISGRFVGDVLDLEMMRLVKWGIHDLEGECVTAARIEISTRAQKKMKTDETAASTFASSSSASSVGMNIQKRLLVVDQQQDGTQLPASRVTDICWEEQGEFTQLKREALLPILDLYGMQSGKWPVIVKPPSVVLSVTQLLRAGFSLNALRLTREKLRRGEVLDTVEELELAKHLGSGGLSELGIVKRFPFTPTRRKVSVICRDPLTQKVYLFCKGSPEELAELCTSRSLPRDYRQRISQITRRGARVVCVAARYLGTLSGAAVERLKRRDAERKLQLLGCVIFGNRLKRDSKNCVARLAEAGCRLILATGDSPLTALAVAKECEIVQPNRNREIILGDVYESRRRAQGQEAPVFVWTKIERAAPKESSDHGFSGRRQLQTLNCAVSVSSAPRNRAPGDPRENGIRRLLAAHSRKFMTFDLRDFLRGKNPRNFEFVLTGRAFRCLEQLHRSLNLSWFGCSSNLPEEFEKPHIGYFGLNPYEDRFARNLMLGADNDNGGTPSTGHHDAASFPVPEVCCRLSCDSLPIVRTCSSCVGCCRRRRQRLFSDRTQTDEVSEEPHTRWPQGATYWLLPRARSVHRQLFSLRRTSAPCSTMTESFSLTPPRTRSANFFNSIVFRRVLAARNHHPAALCKPLLLDGDEIDRPSREFTRVCDHCSAVDTPAAFKQRSSFVFPCKTNTNYSDLCWVCRRHAHKGQEPATVAVLTLIVGTRHPHCKSNLGFSSIRDLPQKDYQSTSAARNLFDRLFPDIRSQPQSSNADTTGTLPFTSSIVEDRQAVEESYSSSSRAPRSPPLSHYETPPQMSQLTANFGTDDDSTLRSYKLLRVSLFEYLLRHTSVFARMAPEDKSRLTAILRDLPNSAAIGGCGDGPNDSHMLWAANVGIGIGGADVPLLAPFCAERNSVAACEAVVSEGRAAMARAQAVFSFALMSSVAQFATVLVLYQYGINYSDWQYIFIDFCLVLPLSVAITRLPASTKLKGKPPPSDLRASRGVRTFVGQCSALLVFVTVGILLVPRLPGWQPIIVTQSTGDGDGPEFASYENSVVFLTTNLGYLVMCMICVGEAMPWLKSPWQSKSFMCLWGSLAFISGALLLAPRPRVIALPSELNPSPDALPVQPGTATVERLLAAADECLCLLQLPLVGKFCVAVLCAAYIMVAFALQRSKIQASDDEGQTIVPKDSKYVTVQHAI